MPFVAFSGCLMILKRAIMRILMALVSVMRPGRENAVLRCKVPLKYLLAVRGPLLGHLSNAGNAL